MTPKPWYASKTIWFNILALAVLVANRFGFQEFTLDPTVEVIVVAIVNLILRLLTRQPIGG